MKIKTVSQDDVSDVNELSKKISKGINEILMDIDMDIAIASLYTSVINTILLQCNNLDEVNYLRAVLNKLFDKATESF